MGGAPCCPPWEVPNHILFRGKQPEKHPVSLEGSPGAMVGSPGSGSHMSHIARLSPRHEPQGDREGGRCFCAWFCGNQGGGDLGRIFSGLSPERRVTGEVGPHRIGAPSWSRGDPAAQRTRTLLPAVPDECGVASMESHYSVVCRALASGAKPAVSPWVCAPQDSGLSNPSSLPANAKKTWGAGKQPSAFPTVPCARCPASGHPKY